MNWRLIPPGPELDRYYLIRFNFARCRDLNDNAQGVTVKGANWRIDLWDMFTQRWHATPRTGFTALAAWTQLTPAHSADNIALPAISTNLQALRCFIPYLPYLHLEVGIMQPMRQPYAIEAWYAKATDRHPSASLNDYYTTYHLNPAAAAVIAILELDDLTHGRLAQWGLNHA